MGPTGQGEKRESVVEGGALGRARRAERERKAGARLGRLAERPRVERVVAFFFFSFISSS